jgi:hypothetical protein
MQGGQGQVGGMIGGLLCVLLVGLPIGALISAVILRAACSFFNKLAGPDRAVPEPGFGKAMGIAVVCLLVNLVASVAIGLIVGAGGGVAQAGKGATQLIANLVSIPVSFLVMGGILTAMLPTSFQRGVLVALIHTAIAIAIGIVIGIIVFILLLALGIGFGAAGR